MHYAYTIHFRFFNPYINHRSTTTILPIISAHSVYSLSAHLINNVLITVNSNQHSLIEGKISHDKITITTNLLIICYFRFITSQPNSHNTISKLLINYQMSQFNITSNTFRNPYPHLIKHSTTTPHHTHNSYIH